MVHSICLNLSRACAVSVVFGLRKLRPLAVGSSCAVPFMMLDMTLSSLTQSGLARAAGGVCHIASWHLVLVMYSGVWIRWADWHP